MVKNTEKQKILDRIIIPRNEIIREQSSEKVRQYDKLIAENRSLKVYVNELREIMTDDLEVVAEVFRELTRTKYDEFVLVPIYWKIHDRIMGRIVPMANTEKPPNTD